MAREPPLPVHTSSVPGLPFFPQSYDTSELLSDNTLLTGPTSSRSGGRGALNSSRHERSRSTPPRYPELPRTNNSRSSDQVAESSSNHNRAETVASTRTMARRAPVQISLPCPSRVGQSEDRADASGSHSSAKKPRLRRSDTSARVPRIGRSNTTGPFTSRRSALDSGRARRSESGLDSVLDMDAEDDSEYDCERPSGRIPGHTVVIPKADYARGRRLLAPANPAIPFTTILMRGEAHFVDQRRKCVAGCCPLALLNADTSGCTGYEYRHTPFQLRTTHDMSKMRVS